MKILFVFDTFADIKKIKLLLKGSNHTVFLFPLTSRGSLTLAIQKDIEKAGSDVEYIQATEMVNSAAEKLRDKYIRFIADFPKKVQYNGKNLREVFAIDDNASLWWFSFISEKNTFKTDSFNRLVQLDAIVSLINAKKMEKILFGCSSKKLADTLSAYASKNHIGFKLLPVRTTVNLKMRVKEFQGLFYLKHSLHLAYLILRNYLRGFIIKHSLKGLKRIQSANEELMIITPYPNFKLELASKGIFKNKFYADLQGELSKNGQKIIWVAMYNSVASVSFRESLEYANKFIKNGYELFFLEEFHSLKIQIKALLTVFINGLKFLRIQRSIRLQYTFGEYNFYPIFKDEWYSSFTGCIGYLGVLYYNIFMAMLRKFKVGRCLYSCEMHAWEKALISARDKLGINLILYAYQSGTISGMLLNYFNASEEINGDGTYLMPKPDKIICNGKIPYSYIRSSGWPQKKVAIAEAIRYNHLKQYLSNAGYLKKKKVVLVAFSISPEESSAIFNICCDGLRDLRNNIEVWIKPHPFLDIRKIPSYSLLGLEDFSFQVKYDPVEHLLSEARVVIAGESSVSIEALASGCSVIIVDTPEWFGMSPLRDIKSEMVRIVKSPNHLRQSVLDIMGNNEPRIKDKSELTNIINDFFCLDPNSDRPDMLLQLISDKNHC